MRDEARLRDEARRRRRTLATIVVVTLCASFAWTKLRTLLLPVPNAPSSAADRPSWRVLAMRSATGARPNRSWRSVVIGCSSPEIQSWIWLQDHVPRGRGLLVVSVAVGAGSALAGGRDGRGTCRRNIATTKTAMMGRTTSICCQWGRTVSGRVSTGSRSIIAARAQASTGESQRGGYHANVDQWPRRTRIGSRTT